MDFVLERSQIEELIELIKWYQKYQPIETNRPSNRRQLIGKTESACKQITKNNGLARPTTLARAKTSQKTID